MGFPPLVRRGRSVLRINPLGFLPDSGMLLSFLQTPRLAWKGTFMRRMMTLLFLLAAVGLPARADLMSKRIEYKCDGQPCVGVLVE